MQTKFNINDKVWFTHQGEVYSGRVNTIKIFSDSSMDYELYNDEKGYYTTSEPYETEQQARESLYVYTKENYLELANALHQVDRYFDSFDPVLEPFVAETVRKVLAKVKKP